jgi:uncharacterized protein YcbX
LSNVEGRIAALHLFPVKSCGGIALPDALLVETGLDLDRAWMVVDPAGDMLTQRELPRMALIRPQFKASELALRAPGMLALHLSLDAVEAPTRVRVWDDEVSAYDMGALAAQWCSDFLGRPLRLVRFDPEQRRLSSARWTGSVQAENQFSDGYPLLVAGSASLADLNARLAAQGHAAVGIERFRPNIVIEGLQAFDEDHVDEIEVAGQGAPIRLRLVKPCARCTIPDVDPETAVRSNAVGDALAAFRADPRLTGAVTFGMNAVVLEGFGERLRVGQAVRARLAF